MTNQSTRWIIGRQIFRTKTTYPNFLFAKLTYILWGGIIYRKNIFELATKLKQEYAKKERLNEIKKKCLNMNWTHDHLFIYKKINH